MLSHFEIIAKAPWIARYTWAAIMVLATFFANQWGVADEQIHSLLIVTVMYAMTVILAHRFLTIDKSFVVFVSFVWDLVNWSLLIYYSGGVTNPLITLFLTVITVASLIMATWQIVALSCLSIGLYFLLWHFYMPLNIGHHDPAIAEKLHLMGMFGVFIFSSIMITALTMYFKQAINRSYYALEQAQQAIHGQRQLLAVSSLAANIAHEMSTPIASMQLLTDEMAKQLESDDELLDDIELLQSQIAVCRQSLMTLKTHIQHNQNNPAPLLNDLMATQLDELLPKVINDWRFINPHIDVACSPLNKAIGVKLNAEQLYSIIMNIFNNAMQAGATVIHVEVKQNKAVCIKISDNGQGISPEIINDINQRTSIPSATGWGLGLTLAKTILQYAGGDIDIKLLGASAKPQGTQVTIILATCQP